MRIKTENVTLPMYWASALINGDYSGCEDSEAEAINSFLSENPQYGPCLDCSTEPEIRIFEGLLCETLVFTFPVNKPEKPSFFVEITDTFGGEANYGWVIRYHVRAKTPRGAMRKIAQKVGGGWRLQFDDGDCARFDARHLCVCAFVSAWQPHHTEAFGNIPTIGA